MQILRAQHLVLKFKIAVGLLHVTRRFVSLCQVHFKSIIFSVHIYDGPLRSAYQLHGAPLALTDQCISSLYGIVSQYTGTSKCLPSPLAL